VKPFSASLLQAFVNDVGLLLVIIQARFSMKNVIGLGIAIGAGFGVALGAIVFAVTGEVFWIGSGIAIGVGVGISIGAAMSNLENKDDDGNP
jgi:hypothetical protein